MVSGFSELLDKLILRQTYYLISIISLKKILDWICHCDQCVKRFVNVYYANIK